MYTRFKESSSRKMFKHLFCQRRWTIYGYVVRLLSDSSKALYCHKQYKPVEYGHLLEIHPPQRLKEILAEITL